MDLEEVLAIFSDFSHLEAEQLVEELAVVAEETDKKQNLAGLKVVILQALEEELKELKTSVEKLEKVSEQDDIDIIRVKQKKKKLEKCIGKMKSLNATSVKIEATENDQVKMAMNKAKMDLMKKLVKTFVNYGGGFALNPHDLNVQTFQLNRTKQENRQRLWKTIGDVSPHNDQWRALFNGN